MDAHVQFLLHHQWPSPAAIWARLPHTSAPGFAAGHMSTHQYSLHATACRVARLSTRSRQYYGVRGFYFRAFPTSGHPEVRSDITTQPTGLLLWWDLTSAELSRSLTHWQSAFMGCTGRLLSSSFFRFRDPRESLLWYLIELAASWDVRLLFASNDLLSVLVYFCQTPNAVFAHRRFGKRRGGRPHLTVGSSKEDQGIQTGSPHQLERLWLFSQKPLRLSTQPLRE